MEDSVIQDDLLEINPELKYLPLSYVKVKKETDQKGKDPEPRNPEPKKEKERPSDPEPKRDKVPYTLATGF